MEFVNKLHQETNGKKVLPKNLVRSTPERAVFYKFESDRAYETSHEFYLGRCSVINNSPNSVTLEYSQVSSRTVMAELGTEATMHTAVKAGVLEAGLEVSSIATLSKTVHRGFTAKVGGTCGSGQSVKIKAYFGGVAVDGSAVYKVYDRYTNEFLGYEYHPVGDIVVDPSAIDFNVYE